MPLYEYRCSKCGDTFEIIQKFSDLPLETCSKCGGKVQKLLSSPAIQFKGTGWYVTDYSRKNGESVNSKSKVGEPGKDASSGNINGGKPSSDSAGSTTSKEKTSTAG
ncbi:MAG: zf-TFIIB domain-containing protein [Acidobacteria bacterium]|nr:zf-TFIIB domain-containing protein [Acidobacteriota bacterium]